MDYAILRNMMMTIYKKGNYIRFQLLMKNKIINQRQQTQQPYKFKNNQI